MPQQLRNSSAPRLLQLYAAQMPAPFDSYNLGAAGTVVLTVPHAGRDYPEWTPDRLAVPLEQVRNLEDRFADALVGVAIANGHPTLIARTPRLVVDLNRAETDFEARAVPGTRNPAPRPSHRARGGLGLVPERLGNVQLWRTPVSAADLAARIVKLHRPWHTTIDAALTQARGKYGRALLLDIHSMPSLPGSQPAHVVVGNRHGASATAGVTEMAVEVCRQSGLRVAVNAPYAGAYMLERHGRPLRGISALQIEIDRRLYLDSALDQPGNGLNAIQSLVATLAARLDGLPDTNNWPLAAE